MNKIVKLHLGSHKTATTYLQNLLDNNRGLLADRGVTYWPLDVVRPIIHRFFEFEHLYNGSMLYRVRAGDYERNIIASQVGGLFQDQNHVIISDENIFGGCDDLLRNQFYPDAESRLRMLAKVLPDWPIEVWLSIRRYDDFFSSVYGEGLRGGHYAPLQEFLSFFAEPKTYWLDSIRRIQRALPSAKLIVWDFGDFKKLEGDILQGLTGIDPNSLRYPDEKLVRPSASAMAINEAAKEAPQLTRTQRLQRILALEYKYPSGEFAPFRPWQAKDSETLFEAFKQEIELIKREPGVEFLSISED